jgi:hypothetical protein
MRLDAKTGRWGVLAAMCMWITATEVCEGQEAPDPNGTVVAIDEVAIRRDQVNLSNEQASATFRAQYRRDATSAELAQFAKDECRRKVLARATDILWKKAFDKLKLTASPSEIREELDKVYPGLKESPMGALTYQQELLRRLVSALKMAQGKKHLEKQAYDQHLAGLFEHETWTAALTCYDSPQKIATLEGAIPQAPTDIYASAERAMRFRVLSRKFNEVVTAGVSVTEEEVLKLYGDRFQSAAEKPEFNQVRSAIESEILGTKRRRARETWWNGFLQGVRFVVKSPDLGNIPELVKSALVERQ